MSGPNDTQTAGAVTAAAPQVPQAHSNTPTVVVMNAPAQPSQGRASVAQRSSGATVTNTAANAASRGVLVNNHVFTGPYIRISRIADGSDPMSPPGSENIVQTLTSSQVLAHGDLASFLQQYTLPNIPIRGGATTLALVFHELNEKKIPTGRRDEMAFSVPPGGFGAVLPGAAASAVPVAAAPAASSPAFDRATEYLLKKLDQDADAARKKADDLQEQLRKATDAQTTFMLTQQMQQAQDLKRELEERKEREMLRAMAPAPAPVPAPVFPPVPLGNGLAGLGFMEPQPPKPDTAAEMAKAFAEAQSKTLEVLANAMRPAPVQPQKDSMEFMLPFITAMNQQAQQQAASQQQMLVAMMTANQQASQQMIQALMTRESPVEKMLWAQLQEVKAAAAHPKADEVEDFAEKLQKMQAVTQMLGGTSSSSFLADLLQNADSIGAGAAQIIAAAKGLKAETGPTKAVQAEQRQLAAVNTPALPPAPTVPAQVLPPPGPPQPTPGMLEAHAAFVTAVESKNEQAVADGFVKLMVELSTAQEPFVGMARRILGLFAEAEEPEDLYEVAKALWVAVGKAPFRPAAKAAGRIFAKWYPALHQAFFDKPKALGGGEEAAAGSDAAGTGEAEADGAEGDEDGEDEHGDDGEDGEAEVAEGAA
jgi:hypothetical protein